MAEVTSYTAQTILDLLAPLGSVEEKQAEFDALLAQLRQIVAESDASREELENVILPALRLELSENDLGLADLRTNVIPNLDQTVSQHGSVLDDLQTVTLPSHANDIANLIENNIARPKTYVQPDEPVNPDADDRDLVYGDVWFDSDDNNRQRVWNGSAWSTFAIDIPDLSITVQKFKTATHMIY